MARDFDAHRRYNRAHARAPNRALLFSLRALFERSLSSVVRCLAVRPATRRFRVVRHGNISFSPGPEPGEIRISVTLAARFRRLLKGFKARERHKVGVCSSSTRENTEARTRGLIRCQPSVTRHLIRNLFPPSRARERESERQPRRGGARESHRILQLRGARVGDATPHRWRRIVFVHI